ncbi:hypothetical protein OVX45_27605, partial [Klebsiella pneumoniae]|uniref:hypothetical protein n=1 Tax=Klebsiella pneumoniae TaxID=573 RepID=UPI00226E3AA0
AEPDRFIPDLAEVCAPGRPFDDRVVGFIITRRNHAEHVEGGVPFHADDFHELMKEVRPRLEEAFWRVRFVRHYLLGFVTAGVVVGQAE